MLREKKKEASYLIIRNFTNWVKKDLRIDLN